MVKIVRCIFCLRTSIENDGLYFAASTIEDRLKHMTAVCEDCLYECKAGLVAHQEKKLKEKEDAKDLQG